MTRGEPLQPLCCLVGARSHPALLLARCRPNHSLTVLWYTTAPSQLDVWVLPIKHSRQQRGVSHFPFIYHHRDRD
jgi:hypothetical protein